MNIGVTLVRFVVSKLHLIILPVAGVAVVLPVKVGHVEYDGRALVLQASLHGELTITKERRDHRRNRGSLAYLTGQSLSLIFLKILS